MALMNKTTTQNLHFSSSSFNYRRLRARDEAEYCALASRFIHWSRRLVVPKCPIIMLVAYFADFSNLQSKTGRTGF